MSKKIMFINGSPRPDKVSCSKKMIEYFKKELNGHFDEFVEANALRLCMTHQLGPHFKEVLTADTLVFVSPLFVDNVPSSVLDYMRQFELFTKANPELVTHPLHVYAFINCGFLGGYQNYIAIEIMQHFTERIHFIWSGGLGVGSGGMLACTLAVPREAKMQRPIFKGLDQFVEAIKTSSPIDTPKHQLLVTQDFSANRFITMRNLSWLKESGFKFRKIYKRPYLK